MTTNSTNHTFKKTKTRFQTNTDHQSKQIMFYFCCCIKPRKSETPGLKKNRVGGSPEGITIRRPLLAGDRASQILCKLRRILLTLQTPKVLRGAQVFRRPLRQGSSFHISTLFFQIFFILGATQKIIKNRTSSKSSQNLKNRNPECPKLDFGAILDPPHPPGAGRLKLHGYNQKPNSTKRPLIKSLPRRPGNGPSEIPYMCLTFRPPFSQRFLDALFLIFFKTIDDFWLPFWFHFAYVFNQFRTPFSGPVSVSISH